MKYVKYLRTDALIVAPDADVLRARYSTLGRLMASCADPVGTRHAIRAIAREATFEDCKFFCNM